MTLAKKDSPEYIEYILSVNDRAVERALVTIYKLQTEDEKEEKTTKHSNGVGFTAADAAVGTYYARYLMSGNRLTGDHLIKARTIALKYKRQLAAAASETLRKWDQERQAKGENHG